MYVDFIYFFDQIVIHKANIYAKFAHSLPNQ